MAAARAFVLDGERRCWHSYRSRRHAYCVSFVAASLAVAAAAAAAAADDVVVAQRTATC